MLRKLLLSFCLLFVMMVGGCTQKEEHDNTTNNSSRISEVEHIYKTNVECLIVGNDGVLVECPSMQ